MTRMQAATSKAASNTTAKRKSAKSSGWLLSIAVGLALAFTSARANAAGFLIYDLSGDALGRASAVTASIDEPAAVWFNPAALAFMPGIRASVGGVLVSAKSRFSPAAGGADTNSKRGNFVLPTLFASALVHDRVAVGLGVYTAFGIGIEWPNDWPGRENAISASLKTVAFNPTVAVKLLPNLSLAAGFDAVRGIVDFTNGLPAIVGGEVELAGGTWGYGANAGLLYRAVPEQLHLAFTYRSRVKLAFDGRADFRPTNLDFAPTLADQGGSATITLPDILTLGVMGRPRPDLTLTLDANLVLWSTYDRIDIRFQEAPSRAIVPNGQNGFTVRGGVEKSLVRVPGLKLRAGLLFDGGAIPSGNLGPGLPDGNRIDGTLGAGYARGRFKVDLGYMFVFVLPARATGNEEGPEGKYHTTAHLLGLTLAAAWP